MSTNNPANAGSTAFSGESVFIAPAMVDLALSGSASLKTLIQLVNVSIPYDEKYVLTLDASGSKDLVSSFVLSGAGSTFAVAWNGNQIVDVLTKVINEAKREGQNNTLNEQLLVDLKNVFSDVSAGQTDGLANILQSDATLSTSVDASGAAADMKDALGAAEREIIAQQIPEAAYLAWADASENQVNTDLPMRNGDKLVFVFNVATNLVVTRDDRKTDGANLDTAPQAGTVTGAPADGATGAGNPYGETSVAGREYTYTSRKIAIYVEVSGLAYPENANGDE